MNIFDRAREMVAQSHGEMTQSEALSKLGRRRRRALKLGVLHVTNTDRKQFQNIETPRYSWQDRADLQ